MRVQRGMSREPLKINFYILIYAETHQICTLRTLRNPLRTLRLNPNHVNRKVRKDRAKDAKNLFLEVPAISVVRRNHAETISTPRVRLAIGTASGTIGTMRTLLYPLAALLLLSFPCPAEEEKPTDILVLENRADPWIIKDGDRYIWCFTDRDLGIALYETDTPFKLGTRHLIWRAPETGPYSRQVWAPELHRFDDRWYVYFAASDGDNATHRAYVLKSKTENPFGEYELIGPLPTCGTGAEGDDGCWAIDMTVLEHNGKLYAVWSGWKTKEDIQYQYIAPMSDPATISGPRVLMCRNDDYLWERTEETLESRGLHEAAQVLKRGNRTFVTYSAGASWLPTYKIGILELVGDDPLNPQHWKKHPEPVFTSSNTPGSRAFGVGHASFLLDEPEPLVIYHTKRSTRPGWERDVYIRKFHFDENDFPVFGVR